MKTKRKPMEKTPKKNDELRTCRDCKRTIPGVVDSPRDGFARCFECEARAVELRDARAVAPRSPGVKPPAPRAASPPVQAGQYRIDGTIAAANGVRHEVKETVVHVYAGGHWRIRASQGRLDAIRGADSAVKRKALLARLMRPIESKRGRRRNAQQEAPPEDPFPHVEVDREALLAAIMGRS